MIEAYALVWPNGDTLLYNRLETVEHDKKWFTANFKKDANGHPHGEPRIVRLVPDAEGGK